jgi:transposase
VPEALNPGKRGPDRQRDVSVGHERQRDPTQRRLMAKGALTAAGADQDLVPASEYRALHSHIAELQRLLDKKTIEAEILGETVPRIAGPRSLLWRSISLLGDG